MGGRLLFAVSVLRHIIIAPSRPINYPPSMIAKGCAGVDRHVGREFKQLPIAVDLLTYSPDLLRPVEMRFLPEER